MKRREFFGVLGGAVVLPACVALVAVVIVFMAPNAKAQEAEPRSYSNTPIGLNFLIAGYLYTQGKIAFDPELSVADAKFHSHTEALAYARSLDVFGKSAKFDVILPCSSFSAGAPNKFIEKRNRGSPLSAKEFANYKQDLIVGVSLQVSAPLGQYDDSKLLNLGNNRIPTSRALWAGRSREP